MELDRQVNFDIFFFFQQNRLLSFLIFKFGHECLISRDFENGRDKTCAY